MSSILRYILVFLAILTLLRLLLRKIFGTSQRASQRVGTKRTPVSPSEKTFKDPQCGMYVASSLAVPLQLAGREYHFCSDQCRDQFLVERQVKSAG